MTSIAPDPAVARVTRLYASAARAMDRVVAALPDLHGELRPSIGTDAFLHDIETAAADARRAEGLLGRPIVGTSATQVGTARDVLWLDEFAATARAATSATGDRLVMVDWGSTDRNDPQSMLEDIAARFGETRSAWRGMPR